MRPLLPARPALLPLLALAALLPLSCSWLEPTDRAGTRSFRRDPPVVLEVPVQQDGTVHLAEVAARGGVRARRGGGDPEAQPVLARAWRSGQAPSYGILGVEGGMRVREAAVEVRYPGGQGQATLVVRILHDHPFEASLAALDDTGSWRVLRRDRGRDWGSGLWFAMLELALPGNRLDDLEHLQVYLAERGPGATFVLPVELQAVW